jgi:3-oxoadipyl-CoA thiolase
MTDCLVVDAVRSPIGRFQGALSGVRPDDLLAGVLRASLERTGLEGGDIDEVVAGCANQAGEDNRNVARMALLIAGLPDTVPAVTVNRLCASGLEAVVQGARAIRCGDARIVVAGGVESMSRAPYALPRGPQLPATGNPTAWDTSLGWRFPNPKLAARFPLEAMGETAENLAERDGIGRADQDAFALRSHQRAVAAIDQGAFAGEIVPVRIPVRKGADTVVSEDEGPRRDTTLDRLAALPAVFRPDGTVTAGNASTLNDGAASVVLASSEAASSRGLRVRARVVGSAAAGVDPRVMGWGPVPAVRALLARIGWASADVDLWEINEAFAATVLSAVRGLEIDPDRVNVHGGAIALGHPLGCSGARLVATLLGALERRSLRRGVAALCVGVGQGLAVAVERP